MPLKPIPVIAGLSGEAERAVRAAFNDLVNEINRLGQGLRLTPLKTSSYNAREGEVVRMVSGKTLNLPRARLENQNQEIGMMLETPGSVRVTSTQSKIDGSDVITIDRVGLTIFLSNGNGSWFSTDGTTAAQAAINAISLAGAAGATGATGAQGQQGFPGDPGEQGQDGAPGQPGVAGAAGSAGATGPAGPQGFPGQDGFEGPEGQPGPPGPSSPGTPGADGATGPQGPMGFPGLDGADGSDGAPGVAGAAGAAGANGAAGAQGFPGADGQDGQDGAQGPPGPMLSLVQDSGATVQTNLTGINFIDGSGSTAQVTAGPGGIPTVTFNTGAGGTTLMALTEVEKNLGAVPTYSGTFTITGLSGLTIGTNVVIVQLNGPYTGKGTLADEAEEQVSVSAQVTSATVITAYWESINGPVAGNVKFGYAISNAATGLGWDDVLSVDRQSGANNPRIISGQYLSFGTEAGLPSTGDVRKGTDTNLIVRSALDIELNADQTGQEVRVIANDGLRVSTSGAGRAFVVFEEEATSALAMSAAEGAFWVRGDVPNVPMFTDDTNADHQLMYKEFSTSPSLMLDPVDGLARFRKSRGRHYWWEDFDSNTGAGTNSISETGERIVFGDGGQWHASTTGASSSGNILANTAEAGHPGCVQLVTDTTNGHGVQLWRGSSDDFGNPGYRGDQVLICECAAKLGPTSSTSAGFYFTLRDNAYTNTIGFEFDTSVGTGVRRVTTAAGTATRVDTTVAPGTGWVVYTIRQDTLGTIDFYMDDVLVGTSTTNVPTTQTMNVYFTIFNRSAAAREVVLDYASFESRDLGDRTT